MYIYFNKAKAFFETFSEWIVFNFYIVVRRENAGIKWHQDEIQLLQRQHKESSTL